MGFFQENTHAEFAVFGSFQTSLTHSVLYHAPFNGELQVFQNASFERSTQHGQLIRMLRYSPGVTKFHELVTDVLQARLAWLGKLSGIRIHLVELENRFFSLRFGSRRCTCL